MNEKLSDELNHKIEQEAKDYANLEICDWGKIQGDNQLSKWELANDAYKDAAEKYTSLWQAAEDKAARYEKALIKIVSLSCKVDSRNAILELKSIASMAVAKEQEALTLKTSEDELHTKP